METFEAISTVLTIREYKTDRDVPHDVIRRILEAGRQTASARNKQPWYFTVVSEREKLRKISDLSMTGRHIGNASFAIVVVTDPMNKWHELDATRAIQNMTIQAWSEGLGNSWVGGIDREKMKELLKIPQNLNLLTVLPFGYPTREYKGKKNRKPLADIAFREYFGNKFE